VSQPQMAALVGIRATTYAAWEAGRTVPSHRIAHAVAHRIASLYPAQVSAAWVLGVGGEADSADEDLLPRMDSNHQPCDCTLHCWLQSVSETDHCPIPPSPLGFHGFCENPVTFLPNGCVSDPCVIRYLGIHGDVKIDTPVSGETFGESWGGWSL